MTASHGPVVIYGATGYTGRLVAEWLLARGASVVLVGRSALRLAALGDALRRERAVPASGKQRPMGDDTGTDDRPGDRPGEVSIAVVALDDPAALRAALALGPVVVNCAGPFAKTGRPVLEAAIAAGAHYLDTTGEQDWIRSVFEEHDAALRAAGIAAVPGMAFSHAPADLLAHLVGARAAPVRTLTIAYDVQALGMSRGTMRSALEQMNGLDVAYEGGTWVHGGDPARRESYAFPGAIGRRRVARYPVGDVITVPRHVEADEVRARISTVSLAPRPIAGALPAAAPWLGRLLRSPAKGLLEALIARLPEGPAESDRGAVRWTIAVTAQGRDGAEARGIAHGPDIYGFSAHAIAEGALRLASPEHQGRGALAAAQAFDPRSFLDAMAAAGLRWNMSDTEGRSSTAAGDGRLAAGAR